MSGPNGATLINTILQAARKTFARVVIRPGIKLNTSQSFIIQKYVTHKAITQQSDVKHGSMMFEIIVRNSGIFFSPRQVFRDNKLPYFTLPN